MALPPFSPQDLAKLVLGYLAEEQLMTAYDEFLQASPYLDPHRNEYDRIFMTSLKNILAEYRAVKIYVETCKPFTLRKMLFQCANIFEMVKFLVNHIDLNKIQSSETSTGVSINNRTTTIELNASGCEVCNTRFGCCQCKNRNKNSQDKNAQSSCHVEANTLDNSVEATALEDLPGNHVTTRKKQVKVLEKESSMSLSSSSCEQNGEMNSQLLPDSITAARFDPPVSCINSPLVASVHQENSALRNEKTMELRRLTQKVAECSDIFNSPVSGHSRSINTEPGNSVCQKVAIAGSFQDFATGVSGDTGNIYVPDSSTSKNLSVQELGTKENTIASKNHNASNTKMKRIIFQVGSVKSDVLPQQNKEVTDVTTETNSALRLGDELKTKSSEQKITILSDVKVDKAFNNNDTMPQILRNATSTPLMHMQTILINGTPAYRHDQSNECTRKRIYTKDEIMAMPTIILVPTGRSQVPAVNVESSTLSSQNRKSATPAICTTARSLEPLVIDVSPNNSAPTKDTNTDLAISSPTQEQNANGTGMLVKTIEMKNASEPKNNKYESANKIKTPQAVPPVKKASSTPRRISHVRVLDFTTPRRILQETINELVSNDNSNSPVEVVLSKSPNLHTFAETTNTENIIASESSVISNKNDTSDHSAGSAKENVKSKVISKKNSNWDADLRALALAGEKSGPPVKPKPKSRNLKRKKCDCDSKDDKKSDIKKKALTTKISKSKRKSKEVLEKSIIEVEDTVTVSVKPNINIIARPDWGTTSNENDNDKSQNKSNNEGQADTPEMDRISLQNVIGAKLNISDLLETPYKQALYDIQMETPRFMGPDLPDEPLSEIKIMNIPTPRFLDTPKPAHGTPYSSRPTDYSSGGSYYKPDDQDYLPAEELEYSVATSKEKTNSLNVEQRTMSKKDYDDKVSGKSSRPVRKCTKNVSYGKRSNVNKNKKELDVDLCEVASSCSETISLHSSSESKIDKEISQSTKTTKSKAKTESKNKRNTSIKRKTPVKKDTPKSFMKIKPRRPTPIKDVGKKKKKSESQTKKRLSSKEKNSKGTSVVTPVPTKSRRKSSTPRKLHCTKIFNSESSGHDSPEIASKSKSAVIDGPSVNVQDSDTEHVPLRWSDDGSQDGKLSEQQNPSVNESDEIKKIQEYIATSELTNKVSDEDRSNLHVDLVKRGFDIETAKIIERDLLDTPPYPKDNNIVLNTDITEAKNDEAGEGTTESDCSTSAHLHIHIEDEGDDEDEDEVELSVYECNEESENYVTFIFDDTKDISDRPSIKLKDKFCMEVCIDDGIPIRLRASPFGLLFEQDPENVDNQADIRRETELAVNSISSIEKLYTPMKDSMKAQYYDIFDSTLTSLDTPLKSKSPNRKEFEATVTEIVLEVEKVEMKGEKVEVKKRKRLQSENSSDSTNECKRTKPEAPYLLHSAIQNIDIESVLSKLHGP